MNNKTFGLICVVGGAAIGSAITYFLTKRKYEKIANEEIESVKEKFTIPVVVKKTNTSILDDAKEKSKGNNNKPDIMTYKEKLKANKYVDYSHSFDGTDVEKDEEDEDNDVEVISPDEFGENDDYDIVSLVFYADGILAYDVDDAIIDNPDELIGEGTLDKIGMYEDDAIHVRNDKSQCYYEILEDNRSYSQATKKDPKKSTGEG